MALAILLHTMKSISFTLRTVLAWLFILNATNGEIKIVNKLSRPIYLQSVSNTARPLRTLSANGGWYNEDWQTNPEGGGISIKMAVQRDMNDIIQFEYTVQDNVVYWDVSLIDAKSNSPFINEGFTVIPDRPGCKSSICEPFDTYCRDVYFHPNDNYAVRGCSQAVNLQMSIGHGRNIGT